MGSLCLGRLHRLNEGEEMADPEKAILKKCEKLLERLRELQAQTYAITEELLEVTGGRVTISDKLKQLEAMFSTCWQARYGSPYVWQYVKDRPQLKRLLGKLELTAIEQRMVNYLRDDDPFLGRARHGFGLFVSQINRYAPENGGDVDLQLEAPVVDCRHTPTCSSDQEHTRKRMADMRQV